MSNIGRNDPCPCGSGKKYKKCCLGKYDPVIDAQANATPSDDDSEYEPYEGESDDWDGWREHESDTPEDLVSEPEVEDEGPVFPDPPEEAPPGLPPEQERLVDEWWKVAKPLFRKRNAEAQLRHLNGFWELHPDLIPYLELEMEFLFELGADLGRQKEWPRFAELLLRLREDHPDAYLRSFGYFDRYLIIEALVQGREKDVPRFFNFFHRYPCNDGDNGDRIARLLAWAGAEEALLEFVKPIRQVPHGPGVSLNTDWLLFGLRIPHLAAGEDPDVAANLVAREAENLNVRYLTGLDSAMLRLAFERARQAPNLPDYDVCRTREAVSSCFDGVMWNFTGFLHRAKGMRWTRAFSLADRLWDYWVRRASDGRPKTPYGIDLRSFEAFLCKTGRTFFNNDGVLTAAGIEAMAHFADYLLVCGALGEAERQNLRDGCRAMYLQALPTYDSTDPVPRLMPELSL